MTGYEKSPDYGGGGFPWWPVIGLAAFGYRADLGSDRGLGDGKKKRRRGTR